MPRDDRTDGPRVRAFWSGTLTFGLVSVPVDLFPANRSGRVTLRMLDEDGTPLGRRYYSPKTGREVPNDRIVRGYEIEPGKFVVVTDEELEALAPEKSRDIDLRQFVSADALDPIFFERGYLLTPGGGSTKAYRLLAETMEQTGRAGIATFVMRGKEYLVAILAENGILRAETLRFHDETRRPEDVGLPEMGRPRRARVDRLRKQIRARTAKTFDPSQLEDRYAARVRQLARKKQAQHEDVIRVPETPAEEEPDVIDLMEVLKRRMRGRAEQPGQAGGRGQRPSRRQPAEPAAARRAQGPLAARSKKQLYERAKELNVSGRSDMSKDELIEAIRRSA